MTEISKIMNSTLLNKAKSLIYNKLNQRNRLSLKIRKALSSIEERNRAITFRENYLHEIIEEVTRK